MIFSSDDPEVLVECTKNETKQTRNAIEAWLMRFTSFMFNLHSFTRHLSLMFSILVILGWFGDGFDVFRGFRFTFNF